MPSRTPLSNFARAIYERSADPRQTKFWAQGRQPPGPGWLRLGREAEAADDVADVAGGSEDEAEGDEDVLDHGHAVGLVASRAALAVMKAVMVSAAASRRSHWPR